MGERVGGVIKRGEREKEVVLGLSDRGITF